MISLGAAKIFSLGEPQSSLKRRTLREEFGIFLHFKRPQTIS
jgi:hypothetical protein